MQTYYAIYNVDEDAYWDYQSEWWTRILHSDCLFNGLNHHDTHSGVAEYIKSEGLRGNLEIHKLTVTVTGKYPVK